MNNINEATQPFKTLQIVHAAQCLSLALFLAVTIILNGGKGHIAVEPNDSLVLCIALAIAAGAPFLSNYIYQKRLAAIDLSAPLTKKFPDYTCMYYSVRVAKRCWVDQYRSMVYNQKPYRGNCWRRYTFTADIDTPNKKCNKGYTANILPRYFRLGKKKPLQMGRL